MALLNYPFPESDVTLKGMSRVLQLPPSPDLYQEFESTVKPQKGLLQDAQQQLSTIAAGQENRVTERFKRGLLSCAGPLSTLTAIAGLLPPPQVKRCTAAKLHSKHLLLERRNKPIERTQQPQVFAATRNPGRGRDEIRVVNLVVLKDGAAGMVVVLKTELLNNLSETVDLNPVHTDTENVDGSSTGSRVNSVCSPLASPLQGVNTPKLSPLATHLVLISDVPSYPDAFSTLIGQRCLYDAWINSLQLSLGQTLVDAAANHTLITPIHMRHYKHGHCDPAYSFTMQSRKSVGALASCLGPDYTVQYTTHPLRLFHAASLEHKRVIWETDELVAFLDPNPWMPGSTILTRKMPNGAGSIYQLEKPDFVAMLQGARAVSSILCERLAVQRCALLSKPIPNRPAQIRLIPLHGLDPEWQPRLAREDEYHPHHPGFCTSKNGPRWDDDALTQVQEKIRSKLPTPNAPPCFDFFGDPCDDNLFSRIVRGKLQQWRVWEDSEHVAFLTPFPNTPGFTVLAPRKPLPSDIFALEEADFEALILATYEVAQLLTEGMSARGVALIFEGYEIDYAHAKLIPLIPPPDGTTATAAQLQQESFENYPGYVSSLPGPAADPEILKKLHLTLTQCKPPHSWKDPQSHSMDAMRNQWYRNLFQIQDTLFHSTVEYFHSCCHYSHALTPLTTDTISSPIGLGSDSEPVSVNLLGMDVNLADSMQFALEYFLRFRDGLPGTYYISPSFRGEDPDATHLNQFYHVECELLGDMDDAITIAEGYLAHLTRFMLKKHSDLIFNTAGTVQHVIAMLSKLDGNTRLPRVPLKNAILMMPSADCSEWVQDDHQLGKKLTRKGEQVLIEKNGGAVWLTEMDHLSVPFYQAYLEDTERSKAKAADLLLGLGETLGLGERHFTPERVQEALAHHAVPEESYRWYINMRRVKPLLTSGWGMGIERYLCWLLQHDDVRDMHIIPRLKGIKYMP